MYFILSFNEFNLNEIFTCTVWESQLTLSRVYYRKCMTLVDCNNFFGFIGTGNDTAVIVGEDHHRFAV